jgi:hypothetical protein
MGLRWPRTARATEHGIEVARAAEAAGAEVAAKEATTVIGRVKDLGRLALARSLCWIVCLILATRRRYWHRTRASCERKCGSVGPFVKRHQVTQRAGT